MKTKNGFKRTRQKLRSGSEGIRFENLSHLLNVAKYMKEAGDNILPISIENCFRNEDISIEFQDETRPKQDINKTEQVYELIDGVVWRDFLLQILMNLFMLMIMTRLNLLRQSKKLLTT
jgi:hypothetical protein